MAGRTPLNLFLDTQVFDQAGYNLEGRDFARLVASVKGGSARLFLTSVTKREIEKHIAEKAVEAFDALQRFRRNAALLSPLPAPFAGAVAVTQEQLAAAFRESWDRFCEDMKVEVIPVTGVCPDRIFDDYFAGNPPFGDGKKKSEFPDAFAAAALEDWCRARGATMVVVSGDEDWEGRCSGGVLRRKPRLVEVFALFPDPDVAAKIMEGFKAVAPDVIETVEPAFPRLCFYLEDGEGEVSNVGANAVIVERVFVLEAKDGRAVVDVDCWVDFTAAVTFENPEPWPGETRGQTGWYMDTQHGTVDTGTTLTVEVRLTYDPADPASLKVEGVDVPEEEAVGVDCSSVAYERRRR